MKHILELELWSAPGKLLPSNMGKDLKRKFLSETGIDSNVFLGLSSVPGDVDVTNLRSALNAGELTYDDFSQFCSRFHFCVDVGNVESASRFLDYSNGMMVAWIHVPDEVGKADETRSIVNRIMLWANENGFILRNPDGTVVS
jgi:hypothetical protein